MESSFNLQLLDSMNEQFPSHLHLYRQGFAKYCLDIINNINDSGISSSIDPVCLGQSVCSNSGHSIAVLQTLEDVGIPWTDVYILLVRYFSITSHNVWILFILRICLVRVSHTYIWSLKGQFTPINKMHIFPFTCSAIYPSRLFWRELLSFGDIDHNGAFRLLLNIWNPNGTWLVLKV